MSKRNRRKAKVNLAATEADQKMQAFTLVSRRPYWIAATFWTTRNASVTVMD